MEFLRFLQERLPPGVFDIVRLTNGLLLLAIILAPLEKLFAVRPGKFLRKGLLTDVGYYFLSSMLPSRLLALPLAALALAVQRFSPWGLHWGAPWWLRVPAALVIAEIGFYWGHRWTHRFSWLWRFHAIHHGPAQMDWLVNTHAHPVDLVFTRLCGYIPLYLLGLAHGGGRSVDPLPLLVALIGSIWGYFIHSNVRLRFGWLEHLVATPAFHHWHHNNVGPAHRHMNYAPILPWVDRIFGTFYLDKANWPARYGVDEPSEDGLLGQLIQPLLPAAAATEETRVDSPASL